MAHYRHILLALGFSDADQQLADKALRLAQDNQASLSLIHVVDNLVFNDAAYGADLLSVDIADQLASIAKKRLLAFAATIAIAPEHCRVEIGSPKLEIVRSAREQAADLIIVGSRVHHFMQELLLGSTANGVMHLAECDVLAVRLNQHSKH